MPDGNTNLDEAVAIEVFGLNIDCCLRLQGKTLESLAVRADIDEKILIGYKLGSGQLTDSRIESIASELGVDAEILTTDHGDSEAREDAIQLALIDSGKMTSPTEIDTDVSEVEEPPGESVHELEPVWEDDHKVSLGEKVFDLKTKELRALVMGHIRAAKGDRSNKLISEEANLRKGFAWTGIENGTSRLYREDLEKIAKAIVTSVSTLLTGYGLDKSKMQRRGKSGNSLTPLKRIIELPPISQQDRDAFFRDRVLNSKTEPAEGVAIGELLELARNQDGVNWEDAWLRLTKNGATVQKLISKWDEQLDKVGKPIQAMIVERISLRFSNDD